MKEKCLEKSKTISKEELSNLDEESGDDAVIISFSSSFSGK